MAQPTRETINRACQKPSSEDFNETYFAHELEDCFGVSANMIGRVAKANHLKNGQNGIMVDALTPGGFYAKTFKYNINGLRALAAALEERALLCAVDFGGTHCLPGTEIARANYQNQLYGRNPELLNSRYVFRHLRSGRTVLEVYGLRREA